MTDLCIACIPLKCSVGNLGSVTKRLYKSSHNISRSLSFVQLGEKNVPHFKKYFLVLQAYVEWFFAEILTMRALVETWQIVRILTMISICILNFFVCIICEYLIYLPYLYNCFTLCLLNKLNPFLLGSINFCFPGIFQF